MVEAKALWEKLRRRTTTKEQKTEYVDQLLQGIQGRMLDVIFKHDASRIVQACIKEGNKEQRDRVCEELKGHYLKLAQSQYGRFLISKILKYCADYRESVCREFYGKVRKFIRHREASQVIEELFSQYANAAQRASLLEEFYGPEFALFKSSSSQALPARSLAVILQEEPAKRPGILKHLREAVSEVMNKGTMGHTIVHRAILEYMRVAEGQEAQELIEIVREHIAEILHTRNGARAAMLLFLYATPKDRKVMLKALKPYVEKVAQEEYGHMVLLRIFDVVDDTVLVRKTLLGDLTDHALALADHKYGRRVLLYLLCGRSPRYFSPDALQLLREGDAAREQTSKKDPQVRSQELLKAVSPALLRLATEEAGSLLSKGMSSQVYEEILVMCEGDEKGKAAAIQALQALVSLPPHTSAHVAHTPVASRALQHLIRADKPERPVAGVAQAIWKGLCAEQEGEEWVTVLMEHVERGAGFVLVALLEHSQCESEVRKVLKTQIGALKANIGESNRGAEVLVEKLGNSGSKFKH